MKINPKSSLLITGLLLLGFVSYAQIINNETPFYGNHWKAQKVNKDTYLISINDKAEIVAAFTDFCQKKAIKSGRITGLGAVNRAELRFFNPQTKKYVDKTYKEQMEVVNLTGNIAQKDGQLYLHIHVSLGNDQYQGISGHLLTADIRGAGEFYITEDAVVINRKFSDEIGLNLYDL
ncbi:PPC domain-containing DNA-binding protein [Chryseobacterium culicis]|uniref:PPC domain-containing protein n=1 Tax=Chryseobacterium culicis TaxID=680127 RepID=A0A2S9CMP4_CHRCI|nr:PPC domain-containing DNA-binding protein [Chryseobacterium culicis]PRB81782.1 hypothetical protein CQ022_19105 [Chryseobacterium culicis]PRB88437.1 hypothetical protein CQ033_18010 [Chryseobacterium culicis]